MSQVVAAMKRREPGAVCFFLKCRGGWRERQDIKQQIEHSGNLLKVEVTRVNPKPKPHGLGSLGDLGHKDARRLIGASEETHLIEGLVEPDVTTR